MAFVELLLIFLGLIAAFAASISIITNISSFFRNKYGFSIWSGVLILFIAFMLILVSTSSSVSGNSVLVVLSLIICVFTIIQDVRLAGFAYGLLGFIFQSVMTLLLFLIIIFAISVAIARAVTRSTRFMTGRYAGVFQEVRYAIILFPVFIRI